MAALLLDANDISRRYGPRSVLDSVSLQVHGGARLALVGRNGSGKSTLLKILAGEETADSGVIRRHGTVAYLPQLVTTPAVTAREAILERVGVAGAERELERQSDLLATGKLEVIEAHATALERWIGLGGGDAEARLTAAAAECGLDPELLDLPLGHLSGGQASRAGLAAVRMAKCDAVLLDEPTNHLDESGLALLRRLLSEQRGAVVLISHDRGLLADFAASVVELADGKATHYGGGWDVFEEERERARARAVRTFEQAVAERDRLAAVDQAMRQRAAASSSRANVRKSPDNDKYGREWVRMRADGVQRRAARLSSRREQIEVPERPREAPKLSLQLSTAQRRSGAALALEGVELRRGDWRLGPLDLELSYGDRVRLGGPNGSGKSSVLAALEGSLRPAAGRRIVAPGAVVATLTQDRFAVGGERSAVACLREAGGLDETAARTALAAFGLGAEQVGRPAETMSLGERTRAELALIAHRGASCLLLDEPTNHLDVESLEVLEAALEGWPGALVVASHDRQFTTALELDREIALPGLSSRLL